jgi:hypothetical protein
VYNVDATCMKVFYHSLYDVKSDVTFYNCNESDNKQS